MIPKEIIGRMFSHWEEMKMKKRKEEKIVTHVYFCDCGADHKSFMGCLLHQIRHPSHHIYWSCLSW